MALNLNFYHEQHKEEYERARDPLKLAGKGALAVLIIAVLYYAYRLQEVSKVTKEAARIRAEWAKLEPAKKKAEAREQELLKGQKTHKALVERLRRRFLFAPVLAQIQEAMDPGIQLQVLMAEAGREEGSLSGLQLVGVAAGMQPRRAAEEFRLRLQNVLSGSYATAFVRYDGTNSLEETSDIVETENGALGVARFRLRVVLGTPNEIVAMEKEEEAAAAPAQKETPKSSKVPKGPEAPQSLPAKQIGEARKTLEGVSKARKEMEAEAEGKKPSAADMARQKGKRKGSDE